MADPLDEYHISIARPPARVKKESRTLTIMHA